MPIYSPSTSSVRITLMWLAGLVSFFFIVVASLFILASSPQPSVQTSSGISSEQTRELQDLILNALTQSASVQNTYKIYLNSNNSNLVLRYLISSIPITTSSRIKIDLGEDQASIAMSVPLSTNVLGRNFPTFFFNIHAVVRPSENETRPLHITTARIGNIPIPSWALRIGLWRVEKLMNGLDLDTRALSKKIKLMSVQPEALQFDLVREQNFLDTLISRAQTLFVATLDPTRLSHYSDLINKLVSELPPERKAISVNALLVPLAASAYQKSVTGADPILENKALLSAIAAYVNNTSDSQPTTPPKTQTARKKIEVRLHRRLDLAQHVTSAAAITASLGPSIAEMISNTKEIYDARFGSGFSFSDLTANKVGIRLARLMTETQAGALEMQLRLSEVNSELDYMPFIGSNIDGIREEEFSKIYQNRNSEQYRQKVFEINNLINSLTLFKKL